MLHAHGRDFITEHVASAKTLGCGYGSRFNGDWTRASRSHCMVLVDDKTYTEQKPGRCLKWDAARPGRAHGVFQASAYPGVVVTREIVQEGARFLFTDAIEGGAEVRLSDEDRKRLADAQLQADAGAGAWHTWRAFFPGAAKVLRRPGEVLVSLDGRAVRLDLGGLDPDVEVLLDTAPPADMAGMEEIVHRGRMLLLRRRIGGDRRTVFRVGIEVLPGRGGRAERTRRPTRRGERT
jgi:hypothetical protein